jgi:hypothetical protein
MPNEALPAFEPERKDLNLINATSEMNKSDAALCTTNTATKPTAVRTITS